jgi:tRNA pseudouridine13 synthase
MSKRTVSEIANASDLTIAPAAKVLRRLTSLTEAECGIQQYCTSNLPKLVGKLKERYSDFMVHEVRPEGEVVTLKSLTVPPELVGRIDKAGQHVDEIDVMDPTQSPTVCAGLDAIAGLYSAQGDADRVKEMVSEYLAAYRTKKSSDALLLPFIADREKRTQVHEIVRTQLRVFLSKSREDAKNNIRVIALTPRFVFGKDNFIAGRGRARVFKTEGDLVVYDLNEDTWPRDLPFHLNFTLYKENAETLAALATISKRTGLKPQLFQIAGTKDKRGITAQRVSAFKVSADRLVKVNEGLSADTAGARDVVAVGDFSYSAVPVKLGGLSGNRFTLVFRNFSNSEEEVRSCADALQKRGFINYYGMQRFGAHAVATFHVGFCILREDYRMAVDLILMPRDGPVPSKEDLGSGIDLASKFASIFAGSSSSSSASAESQTDTSAADSASQSKMDVGHRGDIARRMWLSTNRDAAAVLAVMPRPLHLERMLLEHLVQHPGDYFGAFMRLPRNSRLLYLHAVQSYIWNRAVSERVRTLGDRPVPGDLTWDVAAQRRALAMTSADATHVSKKRQRLFDKGYISNKIPDAARTDFMVRVVKDAQDAASIEGLHHVVLPLPGHGVVYPSEAVGEIYKNVMQEVGLSEALFRNAGKKHKEFALAGGYRPIVERAKSVDYEMLSYRYAHQRLVPSELDLIFGRTELESSGKEGDWRGLRLSFTLPTSCYATMCMREVVDSTCESEIAVADGEEAELETEATMPDEAAVDDGQDDLQAEQDDVE